MTTATIVDPDTEIGKEPAPVTDEQARAVSEEEAKAFKEAFGEPASEEPTTTPATDGATQTPAPGETGTVEASAAQSAEGATAPPAEPEFVQISKSEWEKTQAILNELPTTVKRGLDDVNGKFGGLQQLVQQRIASTPKGQKVEFVADDFKELHEEFPQFADMLLKGLNRSGERMTGTGTAEATQPAINISVLKAEIRQDLAREELADDHADWKEVAGLPDDKGNVPDTEFRRWLGTKPKEEQDRVLGSWNPRLLSKTLTEFKEHQKKQTQTATPKNDSAEARRTRVQSGALPRSAGGAGSGSALSDERQAFVDGFKGK